MAREKEPITPFLSKIHALRRQGVSCILVMGGSGDYFGVSDAVICMDCYACKDVTAEAMAIDKRFGASVAVQDLVNPYGTVTPRCPVIIYPGSPAGEVLSWQSSIWMLPVRLTLLGIRNQPAVEISPGMEHHYRVRMHCMNCREQRCVSRAVCLQRESRRQRGRPTSSSTAMRRLT